MDADKHKCDTRRTEGGNNCIEMKSEEKEEEEVAEGGAEGMCRHPMAAGHVCNQINLHSSPLQVINPCWRRIITPLPTEK